MTITTKFDIGQTVFALKDGSPVKGVIKRVSVCVALNTKEDVHAMQIDKYFLFDDHEAYHDENKFGRLESEIFGTEDELFAHLRGKIQSL